jgi:hypothetical protein
VEFAENPVDGAVVTAVADRRSNQQGTHDLAFQLAGGSYGRAAARRSSIRKAQVSATRSGVH